MTGIDKEHMEYYGELNGGMFELIKRGFDPMSVAQLMQRRIAVLGDEALEGIWFGETYFTGDAIAYKDDRVKIVLDAQPLRNMDKDSKFSNGALILQDGVYETLEGEEFTQAELTNLGVRREYDTYDACRNSLQEKVSKHPFWQILARDQVTLDMYINAVSSNVKIVPHYMNLYVAAVRKEPTMRAWAICNQLNFQNGSDANGSFCMSGKCYSFVGVIPENATPQKIQELKAIIEYRHTNVLNV